METVIIYSFPPEIDALIRILRNEDWITSVYSRVADDEIYNPTNYLYNKETHGTDYQLVIDRNILSFAINSMKRESIGPKNRAALALIAFCGYASITFNPTVAVYEKVNYDANSVEQALEELQTFFRIDDTPDRDGLLKFVVGIKPDFLVREGPIATKVIDGMRTWFRTYDRLKEWDPLYLFALKLTDLALGKGTDLEKFRKFVLWCHTEFRYSMVATFYAVILFSKKRLAKMVKYKRDQDLIERKAAIHNMAWDLFTMNYFVRELEKKPANVEVFFASDDKVVRSLVKFLLYAADDPSLGKLREFLDSSDYPLVDAYDEISHSTLERQFQGKYFKNPNQRQLLIEEYEKRLLA